MNIIEDLWFGNISPWERPFKKDSPYAELLALVVRHQEDLLSRMNDEEKEIFEKPNFSTLKNVALWFDGICKPFASSPTSLRLYLK